MFLSSQNSWLCADTGEFVFPLLAILVKKGPTRPLTPVKMLTAWTVLTTVRLKRREASASWAR